MKKNRRVSKRMTVMARQTTHIAVIMIMFAAMVILNLVASSNCTQLMKTIGEKRNRLAALQKSHQRENARWEEMITNDQLERTLYRRGIAMYLPKAHQFVRIRERDGKVLPGQHSVMVAERRLTSSASTAQVRRPWRR